MFHMERMGMLEFITFKNLEEVEFAYSSHHFPDFSKGVFQKLYQARFCERYGSDEEQAQ